MINHVEHISITHLLVKRLHLRNHPKLAKHVIQCYKIIYIPYNSDIKLNLLSPTFTNAAEWHSASLQNPNLLKHFGILPKYMRKVASRNRSCPKHRLQLKGWLSCFLFQCFRSKVYAIICRVTYLLIQTWCKSVNLIMWRQKIAPFSFVFQTFGEAPCGFSNWASHETLHILWFVVTSYDHNVLG